MKRKKHEADQRLLQSPQIQKNIEKYNTRAFKIKKLNAICVMFLFAIIRGVIIKDQ